MRTAREKGTNPALWHLPRTNPGSQGRGWVIWLPSLPPTSRPRRQPRVTTILNTRVQQKCSKSSAKPYKRSSSGFHNLEPLWKLESSAMDRVISTTLGQGFYCLNRKADLFISHYRLCKVSQAGTILTCNFSNERGETKTWGKVELKVPKWESGRDIWCGGGARGYARAQPTGPKSELNQSQTKQAEQQQEHKWNCPEGKFKEEQRRERHTTKKTGPLKAKWFGSLF